MVASKKFGWKLIGYGIVMKTSTYFKFGFLLLSVLTSIVHAASFDCKKAKSKVEKSICDNLELSQLDEQLAAAYKATISTHPLPKYVKARQKDWLDLNQYCDTKKFVQCLKNNYIERIEELNISPRMQIFTNSKDFIYENSDAVVTIIPEPSGYARIGIWGGFVLHRLATEENEKPTYTGCEFKGITTTNSNYHHAVGFDKTEISFNISNDKLILDNNASENICSGFGRLPEEFIRVK